MTTAMERERARFLLQALEEVDFMGVECLVCGKTIREHSDEEIKVCAASPTTEKDKEGLKE